MLTPWRWRPVLAAAVLAALATPAGAAEVDPLLPADTEAVMSVSVKQLLDSPLAKKDKGLEHLRELIKSEAEVDQALTDLGFDPLTDLDTITLAGRGPGAEPGGLA